MNMSRMSWLPLIVTAVASCATAAPAHFTLGRPSGPPVDWRLDRQSASGKQESWSSPRGPAALRL
jgi:hypothetical protein